MFSGASQMLLIYINPALKKSEMFSGKLLMMHLRIPFKLHICRMNNTTAAADLIIGCIYEC